MTPILAYHIYIGYYINMTSQRWLTDADFVANSPGKSIWWHILIVIVPDQIRFKNNGTLYIKGYGMGIPPNNVKDVVLTTIMACSVGTITGVLFQVRKVRKNEPINSWMVEKTKK